MVDRSIPHFHNDLGVPSIKVSVKEFMCTGASPPSTILTFSSIWARTARRSARIVPLASSTTARSTDPVHPPNANCATVLDACSGAQSSPAPESPA